VDIKVRRARTTNISYRDKYSFTMAVRGMNIEGLDKHDGF